MTTPQRRARCGTTGGYYAHRGRNERPCAQCRAAMAAYQAQQKALRLARRRPEEHGSTTVYVEGCRCVPCRRAAATERAAVAARRRQQPPKPDDPRHGTTYCYNDLVCRCVPCRAAATAARARRRAGTRAKDAAGSAGN